MGTKDEYVLGIDLDGVCADFYTALRLLVEEWLGQPPGSLPLEVSFGLPEWGLTLEEYARVHRWAVTQRDLFGALPPIEGAPASLRRLSNEGIRIRIITHRLYIPHFHQTAIAQTVTWLDRYGFPYRDLCFMEEKGAIGANLYVEDSPTNIEDLRAASAHVLVYSNSTNREQAPPRAENWGGVEEYVRNDFRRWKEKSEPGR